MPTRRHSRIVVRPLHTREELRACLALQRETWGRDFAEAVPPSILKVTQLLGGVAAGAFDAGGRLLGFVFGITGVRDGRPVHWSDMLAVRPGVQGRGIGRRLKAYQRRAARRAGAEWIYWTYDPLVARNAHLNLHTLGAEVVDYVVNMYGDETGSPLHQGLGTDRLVVAWATRRARRTAEREARHAAPAPPFALRRSPQGGAAPIVNAGHGGREASLLLHPPRPLPAVLRIAIPADIFGVRRRSPRAAAEWRRATRAAFLWCKARGYRVTGFVRERGGRCSYLLTRGVLQDASVPRVSFRTGLHASARRPRH